MKIDYNKAEFDVKDNKDCESEKCPRCQMIADMAFDIWDADDEDEAFYILRDIINMVEDSAYRDGYRSALQNQNEINTQIIAELNAEEVSED